MATSTHRLRVTSIPSGLLFECEAGCGRRMGVDRRTGALIVIDKGDQFAQHSGSIGEVDLSAGVAQA
jgi:hypothetical protein